MIIGAQGYTIRDYVKDKQGIIKSIERLSSIGFHALQLSAFGEFEPQFMKELCDKHDMEVAVTHSAPKRILEDTKKLIEEHKVLGCNRIGIGSMPEKYIGSLEGARAFIKDFTPAMDMLHYEGMKLHYHNHAFEFQKDNGTVPFDVLINESDPEKLSFILDTYWVQVSGRTVARQIERLSGRIEVCHLKDLSIINNEQRMAPVYEGNLCWEEIMPALEKAGVIFAMIEQDNCYGEDPFDCLSRSLNNIKKAGYISECFR